MAAEPTVDVVEKQEWLAPVETGLQNVISTAYDSTGTAGRKVKNFLHGVWLGHPLHPVLTDIPIGAWTATVVLDVLEATGRRGYARGADAALTVGLVGAVGAALTGLTDWQATDGPARRVGVAHALLNTTSAGLFTASLLARRRQSRGTGRILGWIGFAASMAAAYLGGNLVYGKQIGVSHTAGEPLPREWTPVLAESELREGEPRRALAGEVKVLLVKRGTQLFCIAEVCSHLGGPLAEGQVQDDVVQCPWHSSRFSLRDGSVIDGPATHPQPCFETRVRNGQVEVRSPGEQE